MLGGIDNLCVGVCARTGDGDGAQVGRLAAHDSVHQPRAYRRHFHRDSAERAFSNRGKHLVPPVTVPYLEAGIDAALKIIESRHMTNHVRAAMLDDDRDPQRFRELLAKGARYERFLVGAFAVVNDRNCAVGGYACDEGAAVAVVEAERRAGHI